ncbi:MAG: energy transducer TonB [Oligoflexales bacterium]|nr:energy transducer TonB [Oligoflexales bacterium]
MFSSNKNKRVIRYHGVPYQSGIVLLITIILSLLIHLSGYLKISEFSENALLNKKDEKNKKNLVQVKIKEKTKTEAKEDYNGPLSKILESKLEKTSKPKDPRYLGSQDHATEKETKIAKPIDSFKGLDPGALGNADKSHLSDNLAKKKSQGDKDKAKLKNEKRKNIFGIDNSPRSIHIPRNDYEKLIPTSSELTNQMKAGYQDYIDEDLATGDRIDLNTSDYRFIGYFTALRKAFELVWSYPASAVRQGWQGVVTVEFTIQKDGSLNSVKILSSSGYDILDQAVVDALKKASPYSPLPDGFGKDKLRITGNFRYVLSNYATGY